MLVKVFVEVNLDESGVWLLEVVSVKVNKKSANVVDELINPREVKERSVNCLWWRLVTAATINAPSRLMIETYHEDDVELLDSRPFQSVLVDLVRRVLSC